jgi:hypothetical protein
MFTLVLVQPNLGWTDLESVLSNEGVKANRFQWPSIQEALVAAEELCKIIDRDGEWRVIAVSDLKTYDPLTAVPLVGMFEPTHVTRGNHHILDGWWACMRRGKFWKAMQASLRDPGASSRAQLFVYWGGTSIPPEKFNQYEYNFRLLHNLPGFEEAIQSQDRPSWGSFSRWFRLMTSFF